MAVDDVIALLGELRAAEGRLAKARVLGRGLVVLRDLSPNERRQVALAIAERAAPDLAPRLGESTGLELDARTLTEVVDLARALDDDEIEGVITRLRDPDARWEVIESVAEATDEPSAEATVTDTGGEDDDQVPVPDPGEIESAAGAGDAAEEPHASPDTHDVPEVPDVELPPVPPAIADPHGVGGPPEPAPTDETATEEPPPPLPEPPRPAERSALSLPPSPSPLPFPDIGRMREETPDAIAAVRGAGTAIGKLRAVRAAGESIYDLGPDGRLELIRALPDGWVRRRAVHVMLENDVVAAGDCLPIIRTFQRATDRNWVAGSMLAERLVTADDLAGVIGDRALERLRGRMDRS